MNPGHHPDTRAILLAGTRNGTGGGGGLACFATPADAAAPELHLNKIRQIYVYDYIATNGREVPWLPTQRSETPYAYVLRINNAYIKKLVPGGVESYWDLDIYPEVFFKLAEILKQQDPIFSFLYQIRKTSLVNSSYQLRHSPESVYLDVNNFSALFECFCNSVEKNGRRDVSGGTEPHLLASPASQTAEMTVEQLEQIKKIEIARRAFMYCEANGISKRARPRN